MRVQEAAILSPRSPQLPLALRGGLVRTDSKRRYVSHSIGPLSVCVFLQKVGSAGGAGDQVRARCPYYLTGGVVYVQMRWETY